MRQIEPQPNSVITYRKKRLKAILSTDCHECFFSVNNWKCTHIICGKGRKDKKFIIIKEELVEKIPQSVEEIRKE